MPVYSFNTVAVQALFDGDGKIVALNVDQVEVATPNYDGDGMPHFSGYPGKGGYNYDENHDAVVDSVIEPTDESFLEEVASWQTKRQRGDGYQLGSGTWTEEMDAFEAVSNLLVAQNALQVAQQSYNLVHSTTLFDYMR